MIERLELESNKIRICQCGSAPLQLLSQGLFPCAPTYPTLAVDLQMLDFLGELFIRLPPNVTSWCDALESILNIRGYKLTTRVCTTVILSYPFLLYMFQELPTPSIHQFDAMAYVPEEYNPTICPRPYRRCATISAGSCSVSGIISRW
jgi:hypothetical protein